MSYDAANEVTSRTMTTGTTQFTYDARGNRVLGYTTYGYDQANRLVSVNGSIPYTYDGDGLLFQRPVNSLNGTSFGQHTWDQVEGDPLLLSDGFTNYIIGPKGKVVEELPLVASPTAALYLHADQIGSTRAMTSSTGHVAAQYFYDAYGGTIASTGSTQINPIQFAGEYLDSNTNFYYLRGRYYDPATAQFISRDPAVMQTRSAYGYVGGNPLNFTDPTGMLSCVEPRPIGPCDADPFDDVRQGCTSRQACEYTFEDLNTQADIENWRYQRFLEEGNWCDALAAGIQLRRLIQAAQAARHVMNVQAAGGGGADWNSVATYAASCAQGASDAGLATIEGIGIPGFGWLGWALAVAGGCGLGLFTNWGLQQ